MLEILNGFSDEVWFLLLAMAPYLLFGFTMAGILKILLPEEFLLHHLSGQKWRSVFKAAVVGVPLPLCSCAVIPVTAHLKRSGAGRGAVLSFLTSTPTTGVDSMFATVSLLGWIFALIRIAASFFIGIVAGLMSNIFVPDNGKNNVAKEDECGEECEYHPIVGFTAKIKEMFRYAYIELIDDIGKWLLIGIIAGGLISYFVPTEIIMNYFSSPWISYPLMLLIGGAMYVCATGSIPIAASLILKGMSPGAGLVFLIAGPATNTATISFVGGKLGTKTLIIYLASIIAGSVLFGTIVDAAWPGLGHQIKSASVSMSMLPYWLQFTSAIILVAFISRSYVIKFLIGRKIRTLKSTDLAVKVPDMTCEHCKRTIENAVRPIDGVKNVVVDLKNKTVNIEGNVDKAKIIKVIKNAGYSPK